MGPVVSFSWIDSRDGHGTERKQNTGRWEGMETGVSFPFPWFLSSVSFPCLSLLFASKGWVLDNDRDWGMRLARLQKSQCSIMHGSRRGLEVFGGFGGGLDGGY